MSISIGRESLQVFFVLGALAYFQVAPLGGCREENLRSQRIRKRSVSWNLPKLSQLWRCNGGFRSCTTQNHLQTNSSRVAACSFRSAQAATLLEFMYHLRIVLSVGGSVWYMIRNLRFTVTIDSVLANSKTQNAFLFSVNTNFLHDNPLAVQPGSTPRPPVQKKIGEILYLLICSFLPCLSWFLRSRVRKSRRDLWITLYIELYSNYNELKILKLLFLNLCEIQTLNTLLFP